MKALISLLLAVLGCQALSIHQNQDEWTKFQVKFGKTYKSPVELRKRISIFSENLKKIAAHNELYKKGVETFQMGVTQFADMTEDEFMAQISSSYVTPNQTLQSVKIFAASEVSSAPESIDWREKKAISGVKNQGSCGACWAFSATGAMESMAKIYLNRSVSLSEQNILDCAVLPDYITYGCNGGSMDVAFKYVADNGIETEDDYPYEAITKACSQKRKELKVSEYFIVEPTETSLREAVGTIGPVSVAIGVGAKFQFYKNGILSSRSCLPYPQINHAVLVVGYGKQSGLDYWLVKNSWGREWGEDGYVKIARNKDNTCSIATAASFPAVTSSAIALNSHILNLLAGSVFVFYVKYYI